MAACGMAKTCYIFTIIFVIFSPNNVHCSSGLDLGNLAEIFSTLAGGDGCKFQCPKGITIKIFIF